MKKLFTRFFSISVLLWGLSFQMAYGIVFVPANSVPAISSNANPKDFSTKFVLAFDAVPQIAVAGGNLVIYKNTVAYKTLAISKTSTEIVVIGKTLEISHGIANFTQGEEYSIEITKGSIAGLGELAYGTYTFTIGDYVAPKVDATYASLGFTAGYYPANVGYTGVSPLIDQTVSLKLYFDEDVKAGSGTVEIYRWDGVLAKAAMTVTVEADNRTAILGDLADLAPNEEYYIVVNPGIVADVTEGNVYAGITDVKVWKFILKDDAIHIQYFMPVSVNTPVNAKLVINFDRPVAVTNTGSFALYKSAVGGDAIQIWQGADNNLTEAFSVSGSTATLNNSTLEANTQYFVEVSEGAFASAADGTKLQPAIARADWSFTTEVNAKPVIIAGGFMPAKDDANVSVDTNVQLAFDMPVEAGTGNIQLLASDGSVVKSFDVKSSDVTFSNGTVSLSVSGLIESKQYYVIIPSSSIRNTSYTSEYFDGVTVPYEWKFTIGDFVAPLLVTTTPTDGVTIADNHPALKLTFNENVMVGSGGSITIYDVVTNTLALTIPITAGMITGKVVTVSYETGLDKDTEYYVLVDGLAIQDKSGNAFTGVSDVSSWTFTTGPVFATALDLKDNSQKFEIFPNPFVNYIDVSNAYKLSKVVFTNIAGHVVKEVVNPSERIELNELRSGIYFVSLYTMDNVIAKTAKIVKRQ